LFRQPYIRPYCTAYMCQIMLHRQDGSLILQDPSSTTSLYRMDLEVGKVVEDWKIRDDISLRAFGPERKFAQMTPEQTLLGVSHNALFRIDPRLSGNKLVESQHQQYTSKNQFSAMATTESGFIAVASEKGDIRLFDRVGIRAKVTLPALGEPITGLDVSADGRWVLGTCTTYLLLIDVVIKDGKYEGELGFKRSFGKDVKPRPRRLQLKFSPPLVMS
jgi:VID27 C-terminal WD40-like domain